MVWECEDDKIGCEGVPRRETVWTTSRGAVPVIEGTALHRQDSSDLIVLSRAMKDRSERKD